MFCLLVACFLHAVCLLFACFCLLFVCFLFVFCLLCAYFLLAFCYKKFVAQGGASLQTGSKRWPKRAQKWTPRKHLKRYRSPSLWTNLSWQRNGKRSIECHWDFNWPTKRWGGHFEALSVLLSCCLCFACVFACFFACFLLVVCLLTAQALGGHFEALSFFACLLLVCCLCVVAMLLAFCMLCCLLTAQALGGHFEALSFLLACCLFVVCFCCLCFACFFLAFLPADRPSLGRSLWSS